MGKRKIFLVKVMLLMVILTIGLSACGEIDDFITEEEQIRSEISAEISPYERYGRERYIENIEHSLTEQETQESQLPKVENDSIKTQDVGTYMSIVVQGAESLDIYDSSGVRLIQEGRWLYRPIREELRERVGQIIPINTEVLRFQYVLNADSYVFRNIIFADGVETDIIVMSFEDWELTSQIRYFDFTTGDIELHVSPDSSQLSDVASQVNIEPNVVLSPADIQQFNDDM